MTFLPPPDPTARDEGLAPPIILDDDLGNEKLALVYLTTATEALRMLPGVVMNLDPSNPILHGPTFVGIMRWWGEMAYATLVQWGIDPATPDLAHLRTLLDWWQARYPLPWRALAAPPPEPPS